MNTKLDANTASHQNAMHMVQQLSQVIVSMSERMENMERLLHLLLENQQVILQMHMMLLLHACIKIVSEEVYVGYANYMHACMGRPYSYVTGFEKT